MSYCTKVDLIDRFGESELIALTDRLDAAAINDAVLNRAIADADSEINAFVQKRYPLPLASVPAALTRIACDLARYALYADQATEQVSKRRDDAVAFLRGIARGEVSLGMDEANRPVGTDLAEMQSDGMTFNRKRSGGFI